MNKKYKIGLILGRFQPLHKGHEYLIREALKISNKLLILVGSSQESRTERNPLSLQERINIITTCFAKEIIDKKIEILGIPDRIKVSNDSSWGEYIINYIKEKNLEIPDAIIEGDENIRDNWYDSLEIDRITIDRDEVPISGTKIRELIRNSNYEEWKKYAPSNFYHEKLFDFLKNILKEVKNE